MSDEHDEHSSNPYLTIDEAAARLKVKRATLAKWRILGKGPAYRDHGVIVYHIDDLDAWSRDQRRTQTPGATGKRQSQTTGDAPAPHRQRRAARDGRRARACGPAEPCDPANTNPLERTAYLRELHDRFGVAGAFAAYHAGPTHYAGYLAGRRSLPAETVAYLAKLAARLPELTALRAAHPAQNGSEDWRDSALFVLAPSSGPRTRCFRSGGPGDRPENRPSAAV